MAVPRGTVGIEGLAEFRRTLGRMDATLQKDLQVRLKEAADVVAEEARRRAPKGTRPIPAGRRPRKRLADTIVPFTRGPIAGIRTGVIGPPTRKEPSGYRYPRRIEYGPGGQPFMRPALEAKEPEVRARMERLLDDLADDWSQR